MNSISMYKTGGKKLTAWRCNKKVKYSNFEAIIHATIFKIDPNKANI